METVPPAVQPCVFCEIVAGRAPAIVVREWEDALAFRPISPVTPGHVLVIPREHSRDAGADPQSAGVAMARAAELASLIPDANIITSRGVNATQTVMHTHLHVLPRRRDDDLDLPWTSHEQRTRRGVQEIYAFEDVEASAPSIFLAGPTPRAQISPDVPSWRPAAVKYLQEVAGAALNILIPEQRYGWYGIEPEQQYLWERAAMDAADVIAFWIPREMSTMPALTTNIEWGRYVGTGHPVAVGWPPEAERNRYLQHDADRLGLIVYDDLENLLDQALTIVLDRRTSGLSPNRLAGVGHDVSTV